MRIPDELLKTVGFVSRDEETLAYNASVFIVMVPFDEHSGCLHLVTAKHVALKLQSGEAVIAMNGKDGLPLWMKNKTQVPWFFHPTDETADVAVLPMATLRVKEYDYEAVPITRFVTQARMLAYGIGLGDDVVNIGFFKGFLGGSRFTPIVRMGTIAMMPYGRLPHNVFGSMEAFLIEERSLGGLSGSPVFVRNTVNLAVQAGDGKTATASAAGEFHLLGLMHGHFESTVGSEPALSRNVHTGVSLVTPAYKILETLFSDDLVRLRNQAFQRGFAADNR